MTARSWDKAGTREGRKGKDLTAGSTGSVLNGGPR